MNLFESSFCAKCPDRPIDESLCSKLGSLARGKEYISPDCEIGPQLAVSIESEAADNVTGRTGMVYARSEIACGKNGIIESPELRQYVGGNLE